MKFSDVYDAALDLLAERGGGCADDDFADRAPTIAAAIVSEAAGLDSEYRRAKGLVPAEYPAGTEIDLGDDFPLCERFAYAASCFMAAMLILDLNNEEYEDLFDRWCEAMAKIAAELPAVSGSTVDVYPVW